MVVQNWHYCYLREPSKWRRELVFLRNEDANPSECAPVANTKLWVMECSDTTGKKAGNSLEVLTFDETRITRRHQLTHDLDWEHGPYPLTKFENGNRILVYRSIRGLEAYDVVTGAVAPWTNGWDGPELKIGPPSKHAR
jgi:hypothetical protein